MYKNYGDRDFFEYGVLIDSNHSDTEFNIIYCRPIDDKENCYIFAECNVNITDEWINKGDVMNFIGMNNENFNPEYFAIGCIEYYGVSLFSRAYSCSEMYYTKEEIKDSLKHKIIDYDNLIIE